MSQFRTQISLNEDGSVTLLARLMADNGSGDAVAGEGKWLEQADFSTIVCHVYDLSNANAEVGTAPTVTVSSVIIDTPVTDGVIWTADSTGYNFKHTVAGTYFPNGGRAYEIEYFATLTGGTTFGWSYKGVASPRIAG